MKILLLQFLDFFFLHLETNKFQKFQNKRVCQDSITFLLLILFILTAEAAVLTINTGRVYGPS